MRITRFFLDNYQFTIMVFLLMIAGGLVSFFTMNRMENPAMYISGGSVVVIYPGASPADMESLVAIPIEEAVNELDDIRKINTTLRDGIATVSIEFEHGTDARDKYDELVSSINAVANNLPEDLHSIEYIRWTSTDVAVMQLALVSDDAEFRELERVAEGLKRRIESVRGVKRVELHAIPSQQVHVSADMEMMASMNINVSDIANAIQSSNANIPGGTLNLDGRTFGVRTSGSFSDIDDINRTVAGSYNGQLVYIENIAGVNFDYEENNYLARFRGRPAVYLSVQQKDDVNIFNVVKGIDEQVLLFQNSLPPDVELVKVFDQSETVERRINGFMNNLYQGIFLVGLITFLALGARSSVIVIMAIPLSIIIGLGIVDLAGFALEQISIAALVVALGLLVDNSIVMVENLNRYLKMGFSARDAALRSVAEIGWPVITATLTTMLAFIPVILLQDKAGDFIRSLPVTIIATLSVSLFITLTLSPFIAGRLFAKGSQGKGKTRWRLFERLSRKAVSGPYSRILGLALRWELLSLMVVIVLLSVSAYAFRYVGISFFPKAETPQMMIQIEFPEGTAIDRTNRAALWVESILDTIPSIKLYSSNIGKGNPRVYYNHFARQFARNFAEIYVELEYFNRKEFDNLVARLRSLFSTYAGARITVREFEQGVPVEAPVAIYLLGDRLDVLTGISRDIEELVSLQEGAVNVENLLDKSQTDFLFSINREKAGILGVPVHEIDRAIRLAINGLTVSKFRDTNGKEYDIVLKLPHTGQLAINDLERIFVSSLSGSQVPLGQLASLGFVTEPSLVSRFNMQRNAAILADVKSGFNLDDVMDPLLQELGKYPFPEGYGYYIAGELENRMETFGGMRRAVLLTIVLIFGVLVFQFRSFLQPLIIFSAIPLAGIGSVWMLLITGHTFSFTAFIGLISLIGIVVNNSIILVDFTNRLRNEGTGLEEALMEAGRIRFMPIVLTSFTTIGGLLPLTLAGGTLWAPMGWTIIGGLLASTVLTLIVVPVLYKLLSRNMPEITANIKFPPSAIS
jgi:multidrug efflux pump subunit AcrB